MSFRRVGSLGSRFLARRSLARRSLGAHRGSQGGSAFARLSLLARSLLGAAVVVIATIGAAATSPGSPILFPGSGTSSLGHPLAVSAAMTFAGDTLTIVLSNTSPVDTTDSADVLSSFYFDIVRNGTSRPTLTYVSGTGSLFLVQNGAPDVPTFYTPQVYQTGSSGTTPSNLKAVNVSDASWQFRTLDSSTTPNLGFGIGTVGNSLLSPNGFDPAVVGPPGNSMINFGIYKGADINPVGSLNFRFLVRESGTFTFAGLSSNGGFTEADVKDDVVFGFGTAPESTFTVHLPEPPPALGAAMAVAAATAVVRRRRSASPA